MAGGAATRRSARSGVGDAGIRSAALFNGINAFRVFCADPPVILSPFRKAGGRIVAANGGPDMEGALQDRGRLRGIAATLLALALLAERAAGRSFPVRILVLAILWRAEAVARAFVARAIPVDCPDLACLYESPATRYGAADGELLALRLRMLAEVLDVLSAATGYPDADPDGDNARPGRAPGREERSVNATTWPRRGCDSRATRSRSRCRDRPCQDRRRWPRDWSRSTPPGLRA